MTDEQKKLVEKLNKDNKKLNRIHQTQVEYAKCKVVLGILIVIVLIVLYVIR